MKDMKCMNPKCDSTDFLLITTRSLTDPDEEDLFFVECSMCGTSGPAEDTEQEAKQYFEKKEVLTRPKSVNLNGDMGPGIFIRDEIDDFRPDGDEMKSFAAERMLTYSNGSKGVNEKITAETIRQDINKEIKNLKLEPKSKYDLEFDANGNPVLKYGPPPILEFFSSRMLAQPFIEFDIKRESKYKEQQRKESEAKVEQTRKAIEEQFKSKNWRDVSGDIKFEKGEIAECTNELAEKCEAGGLMSKGEAIHAIETLTGKCVDAAKAGKIMREIATITEGTYEPKGDGIPCTQFKASAINNKPVIITSQKHTDGARRGYPILSTIMKGVQLGHTESMLAAVEVALDVPDSEKYPHKCNCGSACYDNGIKIKCTNSECIHGIKT